MKGTELLAAIKAQRPYLAVIMLTGHGALETAMTAVKEGAFDYLLKPARPDALRDVVCRALTAARRQREQASLLETLQIGLQRLQQLPAASPPGHPLQAPATTSNVHYVANDVLNPEAARIGPRWLRPKIFAT